MCSIARAPIPARRSSCAVRAIPRAVAGNVVTMSRDQDEVAARRILAKHLRPAFPYRARVIERGSELPRKEAAAVAAIMEAMRR